MFRVLLLLILLNSLACQSAPEVRPIPPLPPDGKPAPFALLLERARALAMAATEAFYVDKWSTVEELSIGIRSVANLLAQATEVPADKQKTLRDQTDRLGQDALSLAEAAKARDEHRVNEQLQRIHLLIRQLGK